MAVADFVGCKLLPRVARSLLLAGVVMLDWAAPRVRLDRMRYAAFWTTHRWAVSS